MFGELSKELKDKVEAYDIGQDYAKHTSTITPGEPSYTGYENGPYTPSKPGSGEMVTKKKVKGFLDREREEPTEKDVKEWAASESTIHKYRERYKEEAEAKLKEVVDKMLEKVIK